MARQKLRPHAPKLVRRGEWKRFRKHLGLGSRQNGSGNSVKHQAQLRPESNADRRSNDRISIGRDAVLRVDGLPPISVVLVDVTRDGCLIATDAILTPGQSINLGLAGVGTVAARVVRAGTVGYGCEFVERLPPGAVTRASETNVVPLDGANVAIPPGSAKFSRRVQFAALVGLMVAGWALFGVAAYYLTR